METTIATKLRLLFLSLVALFSASTIQAENHYVFVYENSFSPAFLEIHPGDSVTWINYDDFFDHTVASDDNSWYPPGFLVGEGDTFTLVFGSVGTYGYHDIFDEFAGTISVVPASGGNSAPSISITSPASNAVLPASTNFTITADASDTDGTITNVTFFLDAVVLGSHATPPYSTVISNLPAGNYTLTARATDNLGATSSLASVNISLITNSVLSSPVWAGGKFQFSFTTIPGQNYTVEYSTNLTEWWPLDPQTAAGSSLNFSDSDTASSLNRFYRVKSH